MRIPQGFSGRRIFQSAMTFDTEVYLSGWENSFHLVWVSGILSACLSVCLSVFLSIRISAWRVVYLYLSECLPICLCIYLSFLPVCMSGFLSIYLPTCRNIDVAS